MHIQSIHGDLDAVVVTVTCFYINYTRFTIVMVNNARIAVLYVYKYSVEFSYMAISFNCVPSTRVFVSYING